MVSQLNNSNPARDAGFEMVQYIAARVTVDGSTTFTKKIGTVPAGSIITDINSRITTAMTGAAAATFQLGTTSTGTSLQSAMSEAAGSETVFPAATFPMPLASDTDIWANVTGTATAGEAIVAVRFIKPIA